MYHQTLLHAPREFHHPNNGCFCNSERILQIECSKSIIIIIYYQLFTCNTQQNIWNGNESQLVDGLITDIEKTEVA